jgi:hypothetical protein
MFGESTGPGDHVPSDAPLGGNRKCSEQSVLYFRLKYILIHKQNKLEPAANSHQPLIIPEVAQCAFLSDRIKRGHVFFCLSGSDKITARSGFLTFGNRAQKATRQILGSSSASRLQRLSATLQVSAAVAFRSPCHPLQTTRIRDCLDRPPTPTMAFLTPSPCIVRGFSLSSSAVLCGEGRAMSTRCARRGRRPARASAPVRAVATCGLETWNELFKSGLGGGAEPAQAIWVLDRMQSSGRKAAASTYEILLEICLAGGGQGEGNRAAAFLLVEKMWADKVLLGDVSLPEDMEKVLRAILPPEAFD